MNAAIFGRYFLDYALLYPSGFLCLACLWEKVRSPRRTACIAAVGITAVCLVCAALCTIFELDSNFLLLPIVLCTFWLLRWRMNAEVTVSQTAFLFSISAVMMAVCSLLSSILNARAEADNPGTVCLLSTSLLGMEARRYTELRTYMENTRRLRHDFRQHLHVIAGLTEAGQLEELKSYLHQYESELSEQRSALCANAAVDALAGHYDNEAKQQATPIEWKLELPRQLPLPEADLCTVLGNLLENALHASQRLPPEQRQVRVMARMLSPAMLGIVVENNYDGVLKKQSGILHSTKHEGVGVGLVSIETAVHKYSGSLNIETQNHVFRVNVLLNL